MIYTTATGVVLRAGLISELVSKVHEHELANGLALTLPEAIEEEVCRQAEEAGLKRACTTRPLHEPDPEPAPSISARIKAAARRVQESLKVNMDLASAGVIMLKQWLKEGGYATQAEANARAEVCAACDRNVEVTCASCQAGAFLLRISGVKKGRGTLSDEKLHHCKECGCSNQIKIWVPKNVIQEKTPLEQRAKLPQNCWILKEAL